MHEIVLIDDDDAIRGNLTEIIEAHSFNVLSFSDGNLAVEHITKNIPDLIICDIMMTAIQGYDILDTLKNNQDTACIPFIFITGKSEISAMRLGMEKGADDYLVKPFSSAQLISAINSRIHVSKIRQQNKENELQLRLDSLSKIISHEYNTPLNGIIGLSDLLLETISENTEEVNIEYLKLIKDSGLRLKSINNKLINFINTLSGSKPLPPNIITIDELQDFTLDIINKIAKEQSREKDINFASKIKKPLAYIVFPYTYLETIIKEISCNALKFSEKGTIVHLHFLFEENSQINLTVKNTSIQKPNFKKETAAFDFSKTKNGELGLTMGLIIINKLCNIQNCSFSIKEYELTVEASLKIRYLE